MLKSLLDRTSHLAGAKDDKLVLPLVRSDASIIAGSAPNAAVTFTGIPSDPRCALTNEEWRTKRHSYDSVSPSPATTSNRTRTAPEEQGARQGGVRLPPRD